MNGWAPATVTVDADGEVVSVTATEPRFTPYEVALLVAARRAKNAPRGSHGLLLSESTDPANQYKYVANEPYKDFAASALSKAQKAYERQYPDADMGSLIWTVQKSG